MTKEKKLYLTAGFLSIVSILLGFIAFSIIIVCTPLHTLLLKGNSTHEYKLYDYEDPIVPIIEDPNQVSLLKDFHSALESFPEYTFLEKINQSLDIQYFCGSESFAPDNINIFEHDGTNYITVNQLLLNKEAFNAERIPLHCGNGFDETSYIVSPDYHISVILGSNYLKYFNIGDVISALNYYEVPTYMVVQGFAEKGACATVNGVTIDLDNYIITASPLFNFMPESFDETRYHGLLYFQKIDSYFMLKKASVTVSAQPSMTSYPPTRSAAKPPSPTTTRTVIHGQATGRRCWPSLQYIPTSTLIATLSLSMPPKCSASKTPFGLCTKSPTRLKK